MDSLLLENPAGMVPFQLLRPLGMGRLGPAYLARMRTGALVTLTVVHRDYAADPRFRHWFECRITAARTAAAPWVAALVDADPRAARPWLAVEHLAAPSLGAVVRRGGPLAEGALVALAGQLAQGLAGLHAAGVVHGDLKPADVVFTSAGPRLVDFGPGVGAEAGPPMYLAPEQVQGAPAGPASDVFSLAAMLVHAALGRSPFGPVMGAAPRDLLTEEPNLTGLPDRLRAMLKPCLAKNPAARPTMRDLADWTRVPPAPGHPTVSGTGARAGTGVARGAAAARGAGATRGLGATPLSERALISCALGAGAALTAVLLLFGLVSAGVGDSSTPHASPASQQLSAYS